MIYAENLTTSGTGGEVPAQIRQADQQRRDVLRWLLRSGTGSVGVVVQVPGYDPYLARVGSSTSIVDNRVPPPSPAMSERDAPSTFRDVLMLPAADQARALLAALSLNKSQLAEVLGVSRPTLYDWLDGKEPSIANAGRMGLLLRVLARAGVTGSAPLNARYVRQPLSERGPSLLEALCAEHLDENELMRLLRDARSFGKAALARRQTREDRLRALGYDEPADDQMKDQLAMNIAMRHWPKP